MSVVNRKEEGAPTANTVGFVGEIYEDTNTGEQYECIAIYNTTGSINPYGPDCDYIWKKVYENTGGGVSSWNDLTDKPFYDESVVYFDTTVEGFEPIETMEIQEGVSFLKVTSESITREQMIGSVIYMNTASGITENYVSDSDVSEQDGAIGIPSYGVFSLESDSVVDGIAMSSGVWVVSINSEVPVKMDKPNIKTLDLKFLPDELYTEIDNRINTIIEEALGGEY